MAISNRNLAADGNMLNFWCKHMQRAGVKNHMVVALDDFTLQQVSKWGSSAMFVSLNGAEESQALKIGSSHAVSGAVLPISM